MQFRCRLVTAAGEVLEGVYTADSEGHLRREFEGKGLHILSLKARGASRAFPALSAVGRLAWRARIPRHEFLIFNQALATLLDAGMPLVQSLDLLRRQTANPTLRAALDAVHERVRAGTALSEAFAEHGELFPRVYTASLVAGERSGSLDTVLRRYVAYEKVVHAVQRRTISALIYPAILIALSIALVGIIVLRVVPAFSDFYATFGADLPWSTRVITRVSDVVLSRAGWLLAGSALGLVALVVWLRQPDERVRIDRMALAVPLVGRSVRKFATSQLARTLSTLLKGGIPLVTALDVAARSLSNQHMARQLGTVARRVREGESLTSALTAQAIVPDVATKMIEVGESTGALQDMLGSLADFYDEEIETEVGRFVTLIEPLILVVMGIVIAGLVLALYLPLFDLSSAV